MYYVIAECASYCNYLAGTGRGCSVSDPQAVFLYQRDTGLPGGLDKPGVFCVAVRPVIRNDQSVCGQGTDSCDISVADSD
jgi:hypothetical protein